MSESGWTVPTRIFRRQKPWFGSGKELEGTLFTRLDTIIRCVTRRSSRGSAGRSANKGETTQRG